MLLFVFFSETSFHETEQLSTATKGQFSSTEDELPQVLSNRRPKLTNDKIFDKELSSLEKKTTLLTRRSLNADFLNLKKNEPEKEALKVEKPPFNNSVIELLDSPEEETKNTQDNENKTQSFSDRKSETILVTDQSPARPSFKSNTNTDPIVIQDTPPIKSISPTKQNQQRVNKVEKTKRNNNNNNYNEFPEAKILSKKLINLRKARVELKKLDLNKTSIGSSTRERKLKSYSSDEYVVPKERIPKNKVMNKSKSDSAVLLIKEEDPLNLPIIFGNKKAAKFRRSNDSENRNSVVTNGDAIMIPDDPIEMLQSLRKIPDIKFMRVTRSKENTRRDSLQQDSFSDNSPLKQRINTLHTQLEPFQGTSFKPQSTPASTSLNLIRIKRHCGFSSNSSPLQSRLVSLRL